MEYLLGAESSSPEQSSSSSPDLTEWLRQCFESPSLGFALMDSQLRYVAINHALAAMNGIPAEFHLGRTVREVLKDAASDLESKLQHVFLTGETLRFEFKAKLPARERPGSWINIFLPIRDAYSNVVRVAAVIVEAPEARMEYEVSGERAREQRPSLEALLEFSSSMMCTLDEAELLPAISDFVCKLLHPDLASIALYDPAIQRLRVHPLESPLAPQLITEGERTTDDAPFGSHFLHGKLAVLDREDLLNSKSTFLRCLPQAGIQSVCFLPLITRKGTLGTLNLGRRENHGFNSEDVTFLRQVAAQVALALDNASAYREIKELTGKLNKEKLYLEDEVRSAHHFGEIIGESPVLQRVLAQVHTVAPSDATVLILGETGTGKELIARAIHRLSSRSDSNFIKLNCAAIPTGLLESELFGHEKGAFTGAITQKIGRLELADKGTLFLDEVGEIEPELQPKLLRVLQDQEFERLGGTRTIKVDVRVIAATNRDLAKSVKKNEFRTDLFYRLNVFPVRMPALRERGKDIPLLVHYFVQKFAKRMNKRIETIPVEAMRALQTWMWPGNVRELENFIERSVILTQGPTLSIPLAELKPDHDDFAHDSTLEGLERQHIVRILRETGGVIAGMHGAAARLGMKRTTLQSRMQKLGINREEYQN